MHAHLREESLTHSLGHESAVFFVESRRYVFDGHDGKRVVAPRVQRRRLLVRLVDEVFETDVLVLAFRLASLVLVFFLRDYINDTIFLRTKKSKSLHIPTERPGRFALAMSMELRLACEDEAGLPRDPIPETGSVVITGGTALALWIRYLRKERNEELTEEMKLAETIADWDFHPTRTTDPNFFFGDEACYLRVDERTKEEGFVDGEYSKHGAFQRNRVRHPDGKVEKVYEVNQVVLRDIVAELFPDECTTDPNEGCALVDYGYEAPHKTAYEGRIIEKLKLHERKDPEKTAVPLPSSLGNPGARRPARDVVSLLHPEVTVIAHLQALGMNNFLEVSREKTKRRAARIKRFHELYKEYWEGFKVDDRLIKVQGKTRDAMYRFVKSPFCKIVLGDDQDAIDELYADAEKVLKRFGEKVSFAPYGF